MLQRSPMIGRMGRVFPVLLAVYLAATQLLAFMHQHPSLDAGQNDICLKCIVLQQAASAIPSTSLSFNQPDGWLILPLTVVPDDLPEMQATRPAARGPPSCTS